MTPQMVPPPQPHESAQVRSLRVALPMLTVGWLLLATILVMSAFRIQRWEVAPGEALEVGPRVSFVKTSGEVPTRHETDNGIHFVTAFGAQLSVLDAVMGWIDPWVSVQTPGRAIIGFVPADTRTVSLPFEVEISTGGIAGPSAGLAFTLALLDELTAGDLMGDGRVVATGTINEDGTVGAIGALEQKAVAVRERGATLFLVPKGQSESEIAAARRAAGSGVKIVAVATVDEALIALRDNGGDPLPTLAG